jgi:hypothetical protein
VTTDHQFGIGLKNDGHVAALLEGEDPFAPWPREINVS